MKLSLFIVPGILLALPACTIVKIEGPVQAVQAHFGVLRIEPAPGTRAVVYSSSGIGIVPGHGGFTLGIMRERAALIYSPEDCRIILFDTNQEKIRNIIDSLAAVSPAPNSICESEGTIDEKRISFANTDRNVVELRHH